MLNGKLNLFSYITDKKERKNALLHLYVLTCNTIAFNLISISFIQMFLSRSGVSAYRIGVICFLVQVAAMLGLLASIPVVDRIAKKINAAVISHLAYIILPAALIVLSLFPYGDTGAGVAFIFTTAAVVATYFITSLKAALDSVLYAMTIRLENRGRFFGIAGVACNLTALLMGGVSIKIIKWKGFPGGFVIIFSIAIIFFIISALYLKRLRLITGFSGNSGAWNAKKPFSALYDVFKRKEFMYILVPNFLRGIVSGIVIMFTLVGIERFHFGEEYSAYIVTLGIFGSILAFFSLTKMYDKIGVSWSCLLSCLFSAAGFALALISAGPVFYVMLYVFIMFGESALGAAVPLGVMEVVGTDIIGVYSSARLLVLSLSMAATLYVAGIMLEKGALDLLLGSGCVAAICTGILYYFGFNRVKLSSALGKGETV
ncbi:MAG: MFS transporter [Ruminiclostridium sp.]|nr:MFS transporter [Ruminiclostridium sp.]